MIRDLLFQFEQKVEHTVDLIELLRMQIEELEEENSALRSEQEKWRGDLVSLIKRFDQIDPSNNKAGYSQELSSESLGEEHSVMLD